MPRRPRLTTSWWRTRACACWSIPRRCCSSWAPRWTTRPTSFPPNSCSTIRTRPRPAAAGNRSSSSRRPRRSSRRASAVSPDDIRELFAAFGPVAVRRMFGGAGIYAEDTMFALVHEGVIYLKADGQTTAAFDRENLAPFTYTTRDGTRAVMSYRRMPDRLYDDPDELATWTRDALAAARRGAKRKRPLSVNANGNNRKKRAS